MTPEQRAFFDEHGYLLLPGCLAGRQVDPIRRHVFDELKRLRIWAGGRSLSGLLHGVPVFQQITRLGQLIRFDGLPQVLASEGIRSAIHALAGKPLAPAAEAQLLLSLPNQGPWSLRGLNWHTDIASPATGTQALPGIQVFALIDDVLPQGGATLAIAGSQRLKGGLTASGKNLRQLLKDDSAVETTLRDHGLRMLEMTGRAGDVYLMDMRLLHTPSVNATKAVRLMATARHYCR